MGIQIFRSFAASIHRNCKSSILLICLLSFPCAFCFSRFIEFFIYHILFCFKMRQHYFLKFHFFFCISSRFRLISVYFCLILLAYHLLFLIFDPSSLFPSIRYIDETRSTLLFAKRAKLVKTNAKRNEIMDDTQMLRKCRRESEMLKIENEKLKVILRIISLIFIHL